MWHPVILVYCVLVKVCYFLPAIKFYCWWSKSSQMGTHTKHATILYVLKNLRLCCTGFKWGDWGYGETRAQRGCRHCQLTSKAWGEPSCGTGGSVLEIAQFCTCRSFACRVTILQMMTIVKMSRILIRSNDAQLTIFTEQSLHESWPMLPLHIAERTSGLNTLLEDAKCLKWKHQLTNWF